MNKYNAGYFILTILAIVGKVRILIFLPSNKKRHIINFALLMPATASLTFGLSYPTFHSYLSG